MPQNNGYNNYKEMPINNNRRKYMKNKKLLCNFSNVFFNLTYLRTKLGKYQIFHKYQSSLSHININLNHSKKHLKNKMLSIFRK